MKVTVVPAQVTTVEDRIAGRLGLSQIMLLITPIFIGSALYAILPPLMNSSPYKLVIIIALMLVCSSLAIRIKGKILLLWLIVVLRYRLRPSYYVFNKNSLAGRQQYNNPSLNHETETEAKTVRPRRAIPLLSPKELVEAQTLMNNPAANIMYRATKKGGLNVFITEVKE
ncbi:MAG TPA: hypothetical protein VIH90_04415 [Candidatus Saccharimonadales bacterium]